MVQHISVHLEKYKTFCSAPKEQEDINKINEHISTLDKKIHQLLEQIKDFPKMSQNMIYNHPFPTNTIQQEIKNENTNKK